MLPQHGDLLLALFEWALQSHSPYAKDDDLDFLKRGRGHNSHAVVLAIAQTVGLPASGASKSATVQRVDRRCS